MSTTSAQLDAFAAKCESVLVWTPDLQGELMDLIREPAMTILQQTIPLNDRTKAMDNIYRCAPRGWVRAEQQLGPDVNNKYPGAVASFSLWVWDDTMKMPGLRRSVGIQKICSTLALAMIAASARVWSLLLKDVGR